MPLVIPDKACAVALWGVHLLYGSGGTLQHQPCALEYPSLVRLRLLLTMHKRNRAVI